MEVTKLVMSARMAAGTTAALILLTARFCEADEPAGREFFERNIRPVLVRHCYECHSSLVKEPKGGLLLDSRAAIRRGGESGAAAVPGNVADSLLISALQHDSLEMPPDKKLPDEVIQDFVKWIEMGAPDPRDAPPDTQALNQQLWEATYHERREWWSLQPVTEPSVPDVDHENWSDQPVDRFVLAKLEQQGLRPAGRAGPRTLIRRLTFALTGLPSTPDEIDAFLSDHGPGAWQRLVERRLDSPHFGEHWARHWMDVVRYTDTYGYEWDVPAKGAWRYRDYLIRAFNNDLPFDQLVREQIAGDLLTQPRIDAEEQINESLIGVMFYQMGEKRHGDSAMFNGIHQEMLDNKIDAFSKTFQALTVSCARCHDHKLEAISQREYYALAGLFMSSRWVTNTVDLPQRNAALLDELRALKARLRPLLAAGWRDEAGRFARDLLLATTAAGDGSWRELLDQRIEKEPSIDDPLFVLSKLAAAARDGSGLAETWQQLAAHYTKEAQRRVHENSARFKLVADFRQGIPAGWAIDGVGLRDLVRCGDFTVDLAGDAVVGRLLPGGLFTGALSPRLNGAVRTPYLNDFKHGHISFEYTGGGFSTHRTIVDNAFLAERQSYLDQAKPSWVLLSTLAKTDNRVYIEFATKSSNPNFPPRVGLGGECSDEQAADPRSWFGLTRAVLHNAPHAPHDELARFSPLLHGEAPLTLEAASQRYADWFTAAIDAWSEDRADEDDVRLINWLLDRRLLRNHHDQDPAISELVSSYRRIEQQIANPWTVNGMADLDPGFDYRLNVRGDYDQLGDAVPRGYLRVLCGEQASFDVRGSGRRQLAEFVASSENPLTARVFVNRVWHWLFGVGIVSTTSDLGHLGELPSHPRLLDYLSSQFVAQGWSLKQLVRTIVETETWRQASQTTGLAQTVDPRNRLLHHFPLRRLEAEAIRDAMLAVSGRLDPRLYGPTVNPHRLNEDPQKRLFSGPLDGHGRRSIYTKITIMEPPRFLATFNQPKPKISTGQRDVTNTATQSLALLNDPLVSGQAECWATSLVAVPDASCTARLSRMFRQALGREPRQRELHRWNTAIADLAASHKTADCDVLSSIPVWKDIAHAMFNMKEFIYIR